MPVSKEQLAQYDSIICVDRSGSMSTPTVRFSSRWEEAKEITAGLASYAAQVDDDGITLISFGGGFKAARDVQDGVDAGKVRDLFDQGNPSGSTPLHDALAAAFGKHFASTKKSIIFVITDGVPDNTVSVRQEIIKAASKLTEATEIRVLFLQVGDDQAAGKYLSSLDNELKDAKFDIVNAIGYVEANNMLPAELYERAILDSH